MNIDQRAAFEVYQAERMRATFWRAVAIVGWVVVIALVVWR